MNVAHRLCLFIPRIFHHRTLINKISWLAIDTSRRSDNWEFDNILQSRLRQANIRKREHKHHRSTCSYSWEDIVTTLPPQRKTNAHAVASRLPDSWAREQRRQRSALAISRLGPEHALGSWRQALGRDPDTRHIAISRILSVLPVTYQCRTTISAGASTNMRLPFTSCELLSDDFHVMGARAIRLRRSRCS